MKVLIACEFSGIVRDAFINQGFDAISCDLLPTEKPGPHIIGDVRPLLKQEWDLVIAHPPCTYLCNSGVRWLHGNKDRIKLMRKGARFFLECLNANAPFIAVENPIMHKYARKLIGRNFNHSCQPYEFGHKISKRICWWTKGWLPLLMPTDYSYVNQYYPSQHTKSYGVGKMRSKNRSRFFPKVARAMAEQWGKYIIDKRGG